MNQDTANAIMQLLDERIALLQFNNQAPHDYPSVRENILQLELQQEIQTLKSMLNDLSSFENEFKKRCALRETDNEQTISLHDMPESICNQLYWQIAELVFQPNAMSDMLAILLPSTQLYLKADLQYVKKNLPSVHYRTARPEPILVNYDKLDDKPSIENFKHYVLTNNTLFDVKTITLFPLTNHADLQVLLNEKYPNIAQKLYVHNEDMGRLSKDILTLNNEGITPKSAIEQLIKGLILGGEKMTGQGMASQYANNALTQFFKYFKELPNRLKDQLRTLKANDLTLGKVIDKELGKGTCVETAAAHLKTILQKNLHETTLISSPAMSQMDLKELKNKYHRKHLNTHKDSLLTPVFPTQLSQKVIKRITIKTTDELFSLILKFPTTLYETLWQNITLKNPQHVFNNLIQIIKEGSLNQEQKQAIAKAITSQYPRFELKTPFLFWAAKGNDILFLQEALHFSSKEDLLNAVSVKNERDTTLLHIAADQPELLKVILDFLPEEVRFNAVSVPNKYGYTPLNNAAKQPESLKAILSLLPEKDRFNAVSAKNQYGNTPLHEAANQPKSLQTILTLLPEKDRLNAISVQNKVGNTPLYYAVFKPEYLKTILTLLPEKDRFKAVSAKSQYGNTALHYAANQPECLQLILNLFPEEEQLNAMSVKNTEGNTPLHEAAHNPASLKTMLSFLPEKDRLKAMLITNKDGNTLLHKAAWQPESLKLMLNLFPEEDRLNAVSVPNKEGKTPMHMAAANQSQLLIDILTSLPPKDRVKIVTTPNAKGNSLLHETIKNTELLSRLLKLLLPQDRFYAMTIKNQKGNTPLHSITKQPKSLRALLTLLPEKDQLDAITTKNAKGNSILRESAKNPSLHTIINNCLSKKDFIKAIMDRDNHSIKALGILTITDPESPQIIRDIVLDKLVIAMNKISDDYISHHADRTNVNFQRSFESGFFSAWRHGQTGINTALKFKDDLGEANTLESAIDLIDGILANSATSYNTHSLSSYLMDGVNSFLHETKLLTRLPNEKRHYSVNDWQEAKNNLMNSLNSVNASSFIQPRK